MPRGRGLRPRGRGLRLRLRLDPGEHTRIRASDRPPRPRRGSVRRASPRRMSSAARFAGSGTPRRRAARRRRGDDDDRSRRRRRRPSAPRPRSRSRSLRPNEETLLRLEGLRARPRSGRRATRAVGLGAGARGGFGAAGSSRWRSRRGLAGFGDPPASSARRASSGLARRRRRVPRAVRGRGAKGVREDVAGAGAAPPRARTPRAPVAFHPVSSLSGVRGRSSIAEARVAPGASVRSRCARVARCASEEASGRGSGPPPEGGGSSPPPRGPIRGPGAEGRGRQAAFPRRGRVRREGASGAAEKKGPLGPRDRRGPRAKNVVHRQGFFFSDSRGNWAIIPRPPRVAA